MEPSTSTQPVIPVNPAQQPKKKNNLLRVLVVLGVLVIAGIVALVVSAFVFTKGVADDAKKIVTNFQAAECQTIYDEQSSKEFTDVVTSEQWNEICEQLSPLLQGEPKQDGVSVEGETGKASTGQVIYLIEGKDGKTYRMTLDLIKEGDNWKLYNFDNKAE